MRKEHCAFALLNNGRCVAPCHYTRDLEHEGDCTGNTNRIMEPQLEVRISGGFIDGTHKEVIHKDGTWRVVNLYKPVNKYATWGGITS
jgi:hypothetical protein